MSDYDVVVLGSGTAGQTAAHELAAGGLRVALVEPGTRPGGTCALHGCQPKKWFYEAAETVARSRHLLGKGVTSPAKASWSETLRQKEAFTGPIPQRTKSGLEKAGIAYLPGSARFEAPDRLAVDGETVSFGSAVVATGAFPAPLPFAGAHLLTTSDRFLELDALPRRLVFVGGGFISFELAHFAARLGPEDPQITILEAADRPLSQFDAQMVSLLVEASRAEGIQVRAGVAITGVTKRGEAFQVGVQDGPSLEADLVVHGAGRAPAIESLNLGAAGVDHTRRGIAVDERMRTTNPKVYAVGDCSATPQLARVADMEAYVAAADILGTSDPSRPLRMDYRAVPAVLFTYPQYAMVGKTEDELSASGVDYRKNASDHLGWPTYKRVGMGHAAFKVLADPMGAILGAHVISDQASGLVNTFRLAMMTGTTAAALYWQSVMSPYPSRESDIIYMLKPLMV